MTERLKAVGWVSKEKVTGADDASSGKSTGKSEL